MAFVKIEKSRIGGAIRNNTVAVTMGSYLADGKVHKSKSVSFRLTGALIKQLGWIVEERRIRISVLEGTDKDIGFIQLMPDPDGYSASQKYESQGISVNVTAERFAHYVLNECPMPSRTVNHMIDEGTLIVECPDWLRFNPLSVPDVPKPKIENRRPIPPLNREQRRRMGKIVSAVLR